MVRDDWLLDESEAYCPKIHLLMCIPVFFGLSELDQLMIAGRGTLIGNDGSYANLASHLLEYNNQFNFDLNP